MDDAASKRIRQHARSPLHWGHLGSSDAELTRTLGHDELTLQFRIQNDAIADVAFSGDACGLSRAAASIVSDHVIGMAVSQIAALDRGFVLELLAVKLAEPRKQCAFLCADLLQAAAQQHLDG